jgi:hypothetical protein
LSSVPRYLSSTVDPLLSSVPLHFNSTSCFTFGEGYVLPFTCFCLNHLVVYNETNGKDRFLQHVILLFELSWVQPPELSCIKITIDKVGTWGPVGCPHLVALTRCFF